MTTATLDPAEATAIRSRLDRIPMADLASGVRSAVNLHQGYQWFKSAVGAIYGPGRLSPHEYFYYRLYDPSLSLAEITRFVGKRTQNRLHWACNNSHWYAAANDKLINYSILAGEGLPIPETLGLFGKGRRTRNGRTLQSRQALAEFLGDRSNYPMFGKPIDGIYSVGTVLLEDIDGDTVTLNHGQQVDVDTLISFVGGVSEEGYLFQRPLRPEPELAKSTGPVLPTVRVLILVDRDTATIESAVLKIPRRCNIADNYWVKGNMAGALDPDSGRLLRVVTGSGEDTAEIEVHPDTNVPLKGKAVPGWQRVVDTALEAACLLPKIRTQSWDIALCESGPVLMDLNYGGDLNLHQLAHRRGILTESYCEHLRRCGYKRKLP